MRSRASLASRRIAFVWLYVAKTARNDLWQTVTLTARGRSVGGVRKQGSGAASLGGGWHQVLVLSETPHFLYTVISPVQF